MDRHDLPTNPDHGTTESRSSFIDDPWKLILFLFLLAGAAGIPAIWASRGLTATGKIVLTILTSLYTLVVLAVFFWFLIWAFHRAMALLGGL